MKKWFVTLSLAIAPVPSALAGPGHNHEAAVEAAPHGGTLRNAGEIKAEIVLSGDSLKLYVYDKQLKPLKMEVPEVKGEVQFPKEKSKPVTFMKAGEFYEATVKGISKAHRYDLHVNVVTAGKKTLVDFGIDNI